MRIGAACAWGLGQIAAVALVGGAAAVGCGSDDAAVITPPPDAATTGADASTGGACAAPATACGAACVDTRNDPANCGACGSTCTGGQVCSAGACALSCAGGAVKCGQSCVDTNVDGANCGACGTTCAAGLLCSNGGCALECATDYLKCGGADDGGVTPAFCAAIKTDSNNCGACGTTCGATEKCVEGKCANGCATSADCPSTAAKCAAAACAVPADCSEIKSLNPAAASGKYTIDPDGAGAVAPFSVWCDMITDGGGWTIVASHTGADGEQPLVSDTEASGNPLTFQHSNLNRAKKMALSALETESIFVKSNGQWLKADKPMFDANLNTADTDTGVAVKLSAMNGATADAYMGYSNHMIAGGGDFGISISPDGGTCGGTYTTVNGFDHHGSSYRNLNCNCERHYLYSYSNGDQDGDAGYDVNTSLGPWAGTDGCGAGEGGSMTFYSAMRRPLATYASCNEMHAALPTLGSGWQLVDPDKAAATYAPIGVYCDMETDGGGYTLMPVQGGISTTMRTEANSCQPLGLEIAVPRTLAHLNKMRSLFGASFFATVPGVYGVAAGNYTGCAMNSDDATCAANWKSIDGKAWFARMTAQGTEPSGDYTPDCWLSGTWGAYNAAEGFWMNDGNCGYATGTSYVCSDNVK